MSNNQKGFSVVEGLLILVIVGIVGFTGRYVVNAKKNTDKNFNIKSSTPNNAAKTVEESHQFRVPSGYKTFNDSDSGFSFSYPEEYGSFNNQPQLNGVAIKQSSEPTKEFGPGIHGFFILFTHNSASAEVNSRKYGPKINLKNGRWIVKEANPSDLVNNKVGEVYKDLDGKTLVGQTNGKLTIYTLKSGDEGGKLDTLVFVSNNKLYELQLPGYSDGLYGNFDQNAKANDIHKFNGLVSNVRDSIQAF